MALRTSEPSALPPQQLTLIARALSDPRRLDIFRRICAGPSLMCADLRECLPISAATLSHHLKELESAGLIEVAREGKFMRITPNRETWSLYLRELQSF